MRAVASDFCISLEPLAMVGELFFSWTCFAIAVLFPWLAQQAAGTTVFRTFTFVMHDDVPSMRNGS